MKPSDFPLEKNGGRLAEFSPRTEQRPTVYRYVDSPSPEPAASPGYDSLLDYWHILFRSRKDIAKLCIGGVVRSNRHQRDTDADLPASELPWKSRVPISWNQGVPPTPVGTMARQSRTWRLRSSFCRANRLLEHVIDKLKLQQQPPTGLRALTSRARRIFEPSKTSNLREKDDLVQHIERNLTVRTSGNSHLLEVLYESPDPKGAADFANTLSANSWS